MKTKLSTLYAALAPIGVIFVANTAHAAVTALNPGGSVSNTSGGFTWDSFKNLAGQVVSILLFIAGFLAVVYLVYNGIQYITSAGNADKVKTARAGIINAVIGIAVIAAAYLIINFAIKLGNTAGGIANTGTVTGVAP